MPLYTFQERFVQFVKEGSKRQTIRNFRKYPVRVGQKMSAYTGPRFKPVKIIEPVEIKDVKCIAIFETGMFLINTNWLSEIERAEIKEKGIKAIQHVYYRITDPNRFAWSDGFRPEEKADHKNFHAYAFMMRWWRQTHELPFVGFVTYW